MVFLGGVGGGFSGLRPIPFSTNSKPGCGRGKRASSFPVLWGAKPPSRWRDRVLEIAPRDTELAAFSPSGNARDARRASGQQAGVPWPETSSYRDASRRECGRALSPSPEPACTFVRWTWLFESNGIRREATPSGGREACPSDKPENMNTRDNRPEPCRDHSTASADFPHAPRHHLRGPKPRQVRRRILLPRFPGEFPRGVRRVLRLFFLLRAGGGVGLHRPRAILAAAPPMPSGWSFPGHCRRASPAAERWPGKFAELPLKHPHPSGSAAKKTPPESTGGVPRLIAFWLSIGDPDRT